MSDELFPKRTLAELDVDARRELPSEALRVASEIVDDVRRRGEPALREHAERLGDRAPGEPLVLERESLHQALDDLSPDDRTRLESVAVRIRTFAQAQLLARSETAAPIPGGVAGTRSVPVQRAGCHAPGGRHPLPSSVLMTAIPARVAGVEEVWVASPRPAPITLAAAALADVDGVLAVGGAQAIAALAHGVVVPQADVIVGPGSHWVTAAKQLVAGRVGIDMLAGPSELVVVADRDADPEWIAADLLAQAEHDPAAWPLLVSLDEGLVVDVRAALERQLVDLPTAEVAREALASGGVIEVGSLDEAAAACDALAPEHLAIMTAEPEILARRVRHAGALFLGSVASEVLGDYGAGPNHVLPTGGGCRFGAGLSVGTFLRERTWMRLEDASAARPLLREAAWLARQEGLEAHARAAEARLGAT